MPTSDQRGRAGSARAFRLGLLAGVSVVLAGCLQPGESLVEDELARISAIRDFGVVSATPERAVIAARGKRVVIEPAAGSCIARESIEFTRRFAFLVVSDCVVEQGEGIVVEANDDGEAELPPAFPGVLTVSISGEPMDGGAATPRDAVERLKAFLATPEGRERLGRSADASQVEVEEMRVVGETLYVLVHDGGDDDLSILAPRFWRAFAEVNGRMVLMTVSCFRDRPVHDDAMLRKLASQVSALRAANGADPATAVGAELPAIMPTERVDDRATRIAPFLSPDARLAPRARPAGTAASGRSDPVKIEAPLPAGSEGPAGRSAPRRAPAAIMRPAARV